MEGVQTFDRVELRTAEMRGDIAGRIDADDGAELMIDAETTDLVATDELLTRVRRALGNPEAHPVGLLGAGSFRGHWAGTTSTPIFSGRFTGENIRFFGVDWIPRFRSRRFSAAHC